MNYEGLTRGELIDALEAEKQKLTEAEAFVRGVMSTASLEQSLLIQPILNKFYALRKEEA